MARYIDADKLKEDLKQSYEGLYEIYKGLKFDEERQICAGQLTTFTECILRIKEQPTADVVEVVRCEKCKHCKEWSNTNIWCNKHTVYMNMKPTDFCSYGERRTNNGE